tara:strand:- start:793 stop:1398 length:606 start_codon:yes stop_codon:yes gene_type:complete
MKKNDNLLLFFLFLLLLCLLFWNTPVHNKGIVSFGKYTDDPFGCNPNIHTECTTSNFVGLNENISNGYYASTQTEESVENLQVLKTEDYPQNENKTTIQEKKTQFGDFAENLYLPNKPSSDIQIEKSDIDMRDESISSWRNISNKNDKNKVVLNLREYQEEYNALQEDNGFKKMSIEEHRQQNIEEWEAKMRKNNENETTL